MIVLVHLIVLVGCTTLIINGQPFQRNVPDGEDEDGATCWPNLQQIAGDMLNLSTELKPLIHLFSPLTRVPGPEEAKEELAWIACQLKQIHSISDLANFVTRLVPDEKVREIYAAFQIGWKALGGLNTVYALGDVLDKGLQLMIDINLPNEVPVVSITQEKLQIRLTEIKNRIHPVILGQIFGDGVDLDQHIQRVAEALFESANFEEFATTMKLPHDAHEILQVVRTSATALQKLFPLVVELMDELHKHRLMDLQ